MRASLFTFMQNTVDQSADAGAANNGIRINSAGRAGQPETLFTTILRNGIAIKVPGKQANGIMPEDLQMSVVTEGAEDPDTEDSADVCTLMMQMMMQSASSQPLGHNSSAAAEEKAMNGVVGVIRNIIDADQSVTPNGPEKAATVILQNDGQAAEVLGAMAETNDDKAATAFAADMGTKGPVAGIAKALSDEMKNAGTKADVIQTVGAPEQKDAANRQHIIQPAVGNSADEDNMQGSFEKQAQTVFAEAVSKADKPMAGVAESAAAGEGEGNPMIRNDRKMSTTGIENTAIQGQTADSLPDDNTVIEKTAAVENALNRFTEDLKSVQSGSQEIRIVLEPESLGVLTITVLKTESGISAKIKAEDKEIVALISDQLNKLVSSMQDKGITVDDVNVVYSQTERQMDFSQHGFSQARDGSSSGYQSYSDKTKEADDINHDFWQSYSGDDDSGDTAVSYRI